MGFAPQPTRSTPNPEPMACNHRGMYSFRDLDAMSYRYCEGCGTTYVLVQDAHDGSFMLIQVPEFGIEKWREVGLADDDIVSDAEAEAVAEAAAAAAADALEPQQDQEQEHLNEFDGGAGPDLEQTLPCLPAEPAEQPVPPRPERTRRKVSGLQGLQAPQERREHAEDAS